MPATNGGESEAFDLWVANAIFAISGIWPEDLCGPQREYAPTCAASRAVACQGVSAKYFDPVDLGDMRLSARVLTHIMRHGCGPAETRVDTA